MRNTVAVLLFLVLVSTEAGAQCPFSFDAPQSGKLPKGTVFGIADFDGDGKSDLLFGDANYTTAIYLGFSKRVAVPLIGWNPRPTDVNGDGRMDIVTAHDTAIIAWVNNGDMTFTRVTTPHQARPGARFDFIWADFNGDGLLDVYFPDTRDIYAPGLHIYLASGDGTFKLEIGPLFPVGGSWIAADLNGDHRADLVQVNGYDAQEQVFVYFRTANGFAAGQPGPTGNGGPNLAADLNRDGHDDVLFTSSARSTIFFDYGASTTTRANAALPSADYASADFNADGAPDLIGKSGSILRIYMNDGHGNFQVTDELPGFPYMPTIFDADGDGKADLFAGDSFVIHGNGDGTFRLPRVALAAADSGVAGDFDGDGDDDIALTSAVAWNNGDNTFRVAATSDKRLERTVQAADVDGDGKAEVIALNAGEVMVFSLRPDGTIVDVARLQIGAIDVAVGDFSGKHRPELAAVVGLVVRVGIGVYEIRSGASPRFFIQTAGTPQSVAAADLNGDGRDELLVGGGRLVSLPSGSTESRDGFLSTFISTGTSFDAERQTSLPNSFVSRIVAGDFDGDGKADLAAGLIYGGVKVLFGDAAGGFSRMQEVPTWGNSLRTADFDGDGRTDLAGNGVTPILFGSPGGLVERGRYFGPVTYFPLLVRPSRGAPPSIIVPIPYNANALIFRPVCPRARSVRH